MSERPSTDEAVPPRSNPVVIGLIGLLTVVIGALESMTIPVLPLLRADLSLSTAQAALIPSTLVITGALATPVVGSLADRYGGRVLLLGVSGVVVAGAATSALAGTFPLLVAGQALQGIGVAFLPLGLVLLRERFPAEKRTVAVGLVAGLFTLGGGTGVITAGPIAENLSWRWMFALPALVITVVALVAAWVLPGAAPRSGAAPGKVDWAGGVLLAATLFSLMLALTELPSEGWSSPMVLSFLAAALVLGTVFVLVESRVSDPFVDVAMLRRPVMIGTTLVAIVLGMGYAVAYMAIPQLVVMPKETGFGLGGTVSDVGLYLFPGAAVAALAGPLAGAAGRRAGTRAVLIGGLVIAAAGSLVGAWMHDSAWQLILLFVLIGIGVGAGLTALYNGILDSVGPDAAGAATGLNTVARSVGLSLGFQVSAAVISRSAEGSPVPVPTEAGYTNSFLVAAAITALAVLGTWGVPGRRAATPPTVATEDRAPTVPA
ncbi:MFS transporter [Streptomyces sp. NPDC004609]|uniref:MFS transporter n=1 Tax=Streptomyces sp. NPDC004609 TaxID=3364704 RepID=UPI0036D0935E